MDICRGLDNIVKLSSTLLALYFLNQISCLTTSSNRLVHSVSGRHHDDRWRNPPGVFRKASETFFDFRTLPSRHGNCRSACRHRTKFFLSLLYPCYLNCFYIIRLRWSWQCCIFLQLSLNSLNQTETVVFGLPLHMFASGRSNHHDLLLLLK